MSRHPNRSRHARRLRHAAWIASAALLACGSLSVPAAAQTTASACAREAALPRPVLASGLATIALQQNAYLGGQVINAAGGLIREGDDEAERTPSGPGGVPAWQRVWDYWRAVPAVYARDFAWREEAGTAEQRIAMVDYPWSAVFISWLMQGVGLSDAQFRFSSLHADYVRAALAASDAEVAGEAPAYAYRACDLATTAPQLGDLMCFARAGDAYLDTFDAVRSGLQEGALPMHCEIVVQLSPTQIATVGGNVVQSVTLRQLARAADGSGTLAPAYRAAAHRRQALGARAGGAASEPALADTYLSQQPWSVLLQLRSAVLGAPLLSAGSLAPPPADGLLDGN